MESKYTKLPGIRSLHDFVVVRHPVTDKAVMTVRDFSYGGPPKPPPIKVKDSFHVDQFALHKIMFSRIRFVPYPILSMIIFVKCIKRSLQLKGTLNL